MKQNLLFLRSVLLFLLLSLGAGQVMAENYLPGTWNNWSKTDDNVKFTDGSLTLTLAANTLYEFKIYDSYNGGKWHGNPGTMDVENCKNWDFLQDINCKIKTTVAGDYTFNITWNGSTPTLSATYPTAYTTTISSTNINCSVSNLAAYGAPGEIVTFTVTPTATSDYSYSVSDVTVIDASENPITVTKSIDSSALVATCSFTMPSSNVTVSAIANDIVVTKNNATVSGNVSGNVIIKNSQENGVLNVNFINVKTLSTDNKWNSSIIIYNTGGRYPKFYLNGSGTNAFVNSNAPGFIINPNNSDGTNSCQPCDIYFNTEGQSIFYIGSNNANCKALVDELSNQYPTLSSMRSTINFDANAKFDQLYYSKNTTTSGDGPNWDEHEIIGTEEAFNDFISDCKTNYQFVKFMMNPKSDIRSTTAAWITACYPYNCTVTNGEVYEVYGRVMYTATDADVISKRYNAGDLKHLILQMRDADHKYKVDAGKGYFVRKIDGKELNITFTIDGGENKHTAPIKVNGFIGTYEPTKLMETGSYFLNASQMLHIGAENAAYVDCYRAYFPYISATDNFNENVEEYKIKKQEDGYYVYERSSGAGGTKLVKISVTEDGILLFDEEITTGIININKDIKTENGLIYDLSGRRIHTPHKGSLYIVNGKKVIY